MSITFNRQDMTDLTNGAIILGSGGGGDVKTSFQLMNDILNISPNVTLTALADVPDDANVCIISGMGSPAATKERGFDCIACVKAVERLEQASGKTIDYVAAFEVGGGNFMPPLYVASHLGRIKAIDADGVGRAVPESNMTMPEVFGVKSAPFAMADERGVGGVLYFDDSIDCERMGRPIVTVLGGSAGVANYLMDGKTAKAALIGGTYSLSRDIGAAVRSGLEAGRNAVDCVAEATGGRVLIVGTVSEFEQVTENAHDWGHQVITGTGAYSGQHMKITIENENIVAYDQDGKVRAMIPDALCVFGADATPLTNADLAVGMEVAFVAVPCHDKWKDAQAMKTYDAVRKHFGYEGPYKSVGELND